MSIEHIVVDGSNIATEGRSLPSLKQLEEAVTELRRDHPDAEITVIVDATFAHRIDASELPSFEAAVLRGEYVHPPAGAIGRGDAFLLRVAEKVDGTVLSNDSFQEFHGEHPWLFERGRLLGGTPVPGIGWIFSPRQPVRGPRSRQAVRETTQAKKRVTKAIAVATKEVVEPGVQAPGPGSGAGRSRRRRGGASSSPEKAAVQARDGGKPTPLAVNDPLSFISFIAEHRLGEQLEAEVEGYTSHGAVVRVGDMRCYVPLANLGNPPPRSAREVLKRHERPTFVLTALDPQRRGAELALPGIAHVSGHPLEETVAAEVRLAAKPPRKRAGAHGPRGGELGKPPVPTAATPPPGRRPAGHGAGSAAAEAPASAPTNDVATPQAKKAASSARSEEAAKQPATKAPLGGRSEAPAKQPATKGPLGGRSEEVTKQPAKATAKKAASLQQGGRRERQESATGSGAVGTDAQAGSTTAPRKLAASKRVGEPGPATSKTSAAASKQPAVKSSRRPSEQPAAENSRRPFEQPAAESSRRPSKTAAKKSAAVPPVEAPRRPVTVPAAEKTPSGRKSPRAVKSAAAGVKRSR